MAVLAACRAVAAAGGRWATLFQTPARAAGEEAAADSLNNLALVLRDQGDVDGARALHERALAIYESRLGADHPSTAKSRRELATTISEPKSSPVAGEVREH